MNFHLSSTSIIGADPGFSSGGQIQESSQRGKTWKKKQKTWIQYSGQGPRPWAKVQIQDYGQGAQTLNQGADPGFFSEGPDLKITTRIQDSGQGGDLYKAEIHDSGQRGRQEKKPTELGPEFWSEGAQTWKFQPASIQDSGQSGKIWNMILRAELTPHLEEPFPLICERQSTGPILKLGPQGSDLKTMSGPGLPTPIFTPNKPFGALFVENCDFWEYLEGVGPTDHTPIFIPTLFPNMCENYTGFSENSQGFQRLWHHAENF